MTRLFLLLTFFACLAYAGVTDKAAVRPEISFPPRAEISQRDMVRLGDIAMVSQSSGELLNILDTVSFKFKETLSAEEVSTLVRNELNSNEALRRLNPTFKIPNEIQLHKSAAAISKVEVERRVINFLQTRCQECEYKVNIQNVPSPNTTQWDLDLSQISGKGSFLMPIRDGDFKTVKWISGISRVIKLTPVATRFIQSGERVQPEDLKLASVDVTFAKDLGLRMEEIQGQQLIRGIQIGQPVWASDIKREPATKKGQIVKATLGSDEFEITTNLEAQDSGFIGDMIKVKNLETQKLLSAVITEKGVVKIQ